MKKEIIGILLICTVLISAVYAFGPHTRFNYPATQEECVYYYGPGNSCEVDAMHCDPSGDNSYIILDKSQCINYIEEAAEVQQPQQPVAQQPAPIVQEKIVYVEKPTCDVFTNYLWLLIPLLVLFAFLVIVWLIYLKRYHRAEHKLDEVRHKKNVIKHELDKELHKKIRAVCPRDGTPMRRTGELRQGPLGGLRQMYVCPKCGHRTMKTEELHHHHKR